MNSNASVGEKRPIELEWSSGKLGGFLDEVVDLRTRVLAHGCVESSNLVVANDVVEEESQHVLVVIEAVDAVLRDAGTVEHHVLERGLALKVGTQIQRTEVVSVRRAVGVLIVVAVRTVVNTVTTVVVRDEVTDRVVVVCVLPNEQSVGTVVVCNVSLLELPNALPCIVLTGVLWPEEAG